MLRLSFPFRLLKTVPRIVSIQCVLYPSPIYLRVAVSSPRLRDAFGTMVQYRESRCVQMGFHREFQTLLVPGSLELQEESCLLREEYHQEALPLSLN